jgi:A/G-specific adenine glycosylase
MPEKSICMLLIENEKGDLLLEKRPNAGLWGGLWSFPECDHDKADAVLSNLGIEVENQNVLPPFRHTFTHFHLDITPILVKSSPASHRVSEPGRHVWYSLDQPPEIGLTGPVTKIIDQLR